MREYSEEYKEDLKADYENLCDLYEQVMTQAGDGPYTEEEELIISDYEDVCAEYEEVFKNKPRYKTPLLNKIREKKKLPASKRKPVYCNTAVQAVRPIDLSGYVLVKEASHE